jgi:short-subunit dehydrogenase
MESISGKVILITGASSGIGEALTYELAEQGARLILSSRRKEELERVKGNCHALVQSNIRILPLDLSQAATLNLCAEAAIQIFGHIDILINNGGISQRSLAKETSIDVDRKIMEVDYFGSVALTKALLPHFLNRKSGHFVTVSSVIGLIGTPAAKHALHGFYDSLRAELWSEQKNIFVTLICPGWIHTNVTLNALTGDGTALNEMDKTTEKGMSPKKCASKIIRAIQMKKEEAYIGGAKEVAGVYLKRFFPSIFSNVVRKVKVR